MSFSGIFHEFQVLGAEIGSLKGIKNATASILKPLIAGTGITVTGLYAHTQYVTISDVGAETSRVTAKIETHEKIAVPPKYAQNIQSMAAIGCPVERDMIQAFIRKDKSLPTSIEEFMKLWESAGYFKRKAPEDAQKAYDELLVSSQGHPKYGKDLDVPVPPQRVLNGKFTTWSEESIQDGLDKLSDRGYFVASQIVPRDQINGIRKVLDIPVRTDTDLVNSWTGPNVECDMQNPSMGKRHFILRTSEIANQLSHRLLPGVMPLVHAYLSKHRCDKKPYMSELQVMVTDPLAVEEFWHKDNTGPGLTIIVPLTPVPRKVGLVGMLPFSQRNSIHSVIGQTSIPMEMGDTLIYDARLLTKTLRNSTYNQSRIIAIFRFDFEEPPGQGAMATAWNAFSGRSYVYLGKLRAKLNQEKKE